LLGILIIFRSSASLEAQVPGHNDANNEDYESDSDASQAPCRSPRQRQHACGEAQRKSERAGQPRIQSIAAISPHGETLSLCRFYGL
jgi:hypothetical protein